MNDRLTWYDHVSCVSKKVAKAIKTLQAFFDNKTSFILYHHIIICHIISGIQSYYIRDDLFLLKKKAFRLICNIQIIPNHLVPTNELSGSLHLLHLPVLNIYFISITGHQLINKTCPPFMLENSNFSRIFNMRDMFKLDLTSNNFLVNMIASTFNNIPFNLCSILNYKLFKC